MPDGGRLSWNSVAAPDFGSSIQAYKAFSDMMSQAAQSGQDVVKGIQTAQGTNADRALQLNLMKYTNPEDLQAAEANGSALNGVNTNHLTPDQLAAVPGRVTTLLSQQTTGLGNDAQRMTNALDAIKKPIEGTDATNSVAARPFQFDLHKIAMDPQYAKDPVAGQAAVTKYLADNPNAGKALSLLPDGAQYQNFQDIQNLVRNSLTNQGSALGNTSQQYANENTADSVSARKLADFVRTQGSGVQSWDPFFGPAYRDQLHKMGFNDNAIAMARPMLYGDPSAPASFVASDGQSSGGGGSSSGGMPGGGGGSIPGGDATRVLNNVARGAGLGPSLPDNVKTMGDFSNWANQANAKGVSSTAAGLYQIEGSTLRSVAPQVLGADWQTKPFDAQNQDKVAERIYNTNNNTVEALRKQWPSLKPEVAAQLVSNKVPWEQARNIIAPGESGATADMLRGFLGEGAQTTALTTNLGQNTLTNLQRGAVAFQQLQKDPRSADDIAHDVTTKGGKFEGNNAGDVREAIMAFMHKHGGNAAQAEWAIENARTSDRGWIKQGIQALGHSTGFTNDNLSSNTDDELLNSWGKLLEHPDQMGAEAARSSVGNNAAGMVEQSAANLQAARSQMFQHRQTAALANRPYNPQADAMMLERAYGLRAGSLSVGSEVAGSGNTAPAETNNTPVQTSTPKVRVSAALTKASAPAGPVNSNQPDHTGRQFGPLKIFVPENQFNNQNDLNNYVQQKSDQVRRIYAPAEQMSMKAQGILRMGGAVGNAQRAAFQSQYNMTPEQALQVAGQRMNQAKAMLRSYQ